MRLSGYRGYLRVLFGSMREKTSIKKACDIYKGAAKEIPADTRNTRKKSATVCHCEMKWPSAGSGGWHGLSESGSLSGMR
jgi:hypothetical protein